VAKVTCQRSYIYLKIDDLNFTAWRFQVFPISRAFEWKFEYFHMKILACGKESEKNIKRLTTVPLITQSCEGIA
jgi:hypothetical protein